MCSHHCSLHLVMLTSLSLQDTYLEKHMLKHRGEEKNNATASGMAPGSTEKQLTAFSSMKTPQKTVDGYDCWNNSPKRSSLEGLHGALSNVFSAPVMPETHYSWNTPIKMETQTDEQTNQVSLPPISLPQSSSAYGGKYSNSTAASPQYLQTSDKRPLSQGPHSVRGVGKSSSSAFTPVGNSANLGVDPMVQHSTAGRPSYFPFEPFYPKVHQSEQMYEPRSMYQNGLPPSNYAMNYYMPSHGAYQTDGFHEKETHEYSD